MPTLNNNELTSNTDELREKEKEIETLKMRHSRIIDRIIIIGSCVVSIGGNYLIEHEDHEGHTHEDHIERVEKVIYLADADSLKTHQNSYRTYTVTEEDFLKLQEAKRADKDR